MPQDRVSGAAANAWGRDIARRIAAKIGATMTNRSSNEATLGEKHVVIKCAAPKTDSVGVTYKMLDTLDSVVGAFRLDDSSFELWTLSPAYFRKGMRATRSRGAAAGKVGLVRRDVFQKQGKLIGRIHLDRMV